MRCASSPGACVSLKALAWRFRASGAASLAARATPRTTPQRGSRLLCTPHAKKSDKARRFCAAICIQGCTLMTCVLQSSADGASGEKKSGPKREAKVVAKIAALQAELAQIRAQRAAETIDASIAQPTPLAEADGGDTRLSASSNSQLGEADAQIHSSWPLLANGCEDIAAMRFLHVALSAAGYYCGEVDETEWLFGEGTLNAVLTFQACSGVAETGVTDAATWKALLGDVACAAAAPFSTAGGPVSDGAGAVADAGHAEAPPAADATLRRKRKAAKGGAAAGAAATATAGARATAAGARRGGDSLDPRPVRRRAPRRPAAARTRPPTPFSCARRTRLLPGRSTLRARTTPSSRGLP